MGQQKKAHYEICPQLTNRLVNEFRRADKSYRNATPKAIMNEIFAYRPSLVHSLDFMILAEEHFWKRSGGHAVFPESPVVLDNLVKAKYHLEDASGIDLPFESFILSIPQGYKIDGIAIPSTLVTWVPYQQSQNHTINPFCDYIGIARPEQVNHEPSGEAERSLGIVFRDQNNPSVYNRALAIESKLPAILKAKDIYEFNAVLGKYDDNTFKNVITSDATDLFIQFHLFKLIAALAVYNQATGGKRLLDGFPGSLMPKMIGKAESMDVKISTLNNFTPPPTARAAAEMHARTWFFRQLNSERYYQGEYEKMRRGSRYVFVSETVVGAKVAPHTQK